MPLYIPQVPVFSNRVCRRLSRDTIRLRSPPFAYPPQTQVIFSFPFQSITHHIQTVLSHCSVPHLTHFVCHILTTESDWIDDGLRRLFTCFHGFEKLRVIGLAPLMFEDPCWLEPSIQLFLCNRAGELVPQERERLRIG